MGNRVDFIGIPLDNLSMSETLDKNRRFNIK